MTGVLTCALPIYGSSNLNAAPEVQGIGVSSKLIKSQTLPDNTSSATTINEYPALTSKGISIKYKITRGTLDRTGEFVISASTTAVGFDDTFTESGATVGVTLSAVLDDKDSRQAMRQLHSNSLLQAQVRPQQ